MLKTMKLGGSKLRFTLILNIGDILTSHIDETSIKNSKIWTCEITLLPIIFFV